MLMIFIYCFVGMLAAVGITGVLATINSNIALRTSEFAVLQAVGMDHQGLKKMLNLESLLYGMKSLIIGIPLGIALSYALHRLFQLNVDFVFKIPLLAVLICIIGVFAVTFISMRYASGKQRRGNIAEAMRAASI
jgi:putative ABC transport system permease protein